MAYIYPNFPSKIAARRAIAAGDKITCMENTPHGQDKVFSGSATIEGPHYPQPHRWYGRAEIVDGFVVRLV